MKPAAFDYHAPTTLDEALALLAAYGDEAKILAGGQSLIPAMNFRLAQPAILVDINPVTTLVGIHAEGDGGLRIGTMTRQRTVEHSDLVAARAPLLAETMPHIAHPQIRNRGTFGGSLAHADPASELPAVAVALGMTLRAQSTRGERDIDATDFFQGLFATALEPDEMLIEVLIPALPARTGTAFAEVARRHGDYAMAGAAAVVTLAEDGTIAACKLVYLSIGDAPVESHSAASALLGVIPTDEAIRAAAEAMEQDIDPLGDIHATAAYRRHLAKVLARRTLASAVARARN
ncbi:MAG: xanthine dehydrogenase family protein subunit M [Ardenticatenales bacterium]|nr:xanthine dehydrogenase family protein subunit M [Ardenticatenales bacterium]